MKLRPFSILALLSLTLPVAAATNTLTAQDAGKIQKGEMAGYLLVPKERVPETYNAGFSIYVAAWPLLDQYPGQRFQTGLFGTWMFARNEAPPLIKLYSDIHRLWKKDRDYLPPPAIGELAELDPALIIIPPPGLEVGYVPIATRQAARK